ncbi:MAG: hypothetical protein ACTS27_01895 [Phycisphaerales bacterium]
MRSEHASGSTKTPTPTTTPGRPASPTAANRFRLDYRAEADRLGPPPCPILDVHSHINGDRASAIYREARDRYGVTTTWSMSRIEEAPVVRKNLGDTVRFIAVPNFMSDDRVRAHTDGYLEDIRRWHGEFGARIVKFWCAPRGVDYADEVGQPDMLRLDGPWRRKQMDLATDLGMMFMAHIADPDTWFQTKYKDASRYGSKAEQYVALEKLGAEYTQPWIIAHMGGWPEDLDFLDGLLTRRDNFSLDASATKWIVREISKHPRSKVLAFMEKWKGRILFGSDIVTMDAHLTSDEGYRGMGELSSGPEQAFDLYASRYWALRKLWESDYAGESPIADPDLMLVDPENSDAMSAPRLAGKSLPPDLLKSLYHDAAAALLRL